MSKDSIMTMLKTLCEYKNVEIKHTFSSNDQPRLTIRCIKNTETIELTNHTDNSVKLYDSLEESAEAIQQFITENAIV